MYTMEYYSAIKRMKSYHLQQYGWTWGYYAKWNKSEREKQIPYGFTYMWNLKNKINEQTKLKQTHWEQTDGCHGGGVFGNR